ncbi:MAG: hypothetical protein IPJ30_11450 [Acidobacteria bacterium]|nr:hypothetical protein [Acidobacteriota bacterium]
MKAGLTAASSGNHDLDSRFLSSVDAKDALLKLEPPYPLPDENSNFKYWARNYVIWEHASYRLVILNSSAHHGGAPNEIDHGRISDTILAFLDRELDGLEPKRVNILLCHHHPQQHMELKLGDYDVMKNGQLLLDLLGSGKHGRWLVIHGHKHHPKVSYAAGSSSSPVIFSAGSPCATLYRELQTRARNQFYLIKLPLADIDEFGLVGEVDAWDWAVGDGWGPAASGNSGLPSKSYFGYRGDPSFVANKISSLLTSEKMPWEQVVEKYREFQYLLPSDLYVIKDQLESRSRIAIVFNNGQPIEVGKIMEP